MLVYVIDLYLIFSLIHTITSTALQVANWCKDTTQLRFLFGFGQKIHMLINELEILKLITVCSLSNHKLTFIAKFTQEHLSYKE